MISIEALHADEGRRRELFPVCTESVFLAHAGVCPLPRPVAAAMENYQTMAMYGDQEEKLPSDFFGSIRSNAAGLLGCKPREIALVGPTSLALSYVASGLSFRRQDNILVYFDDYPSNVYPWMALAEKGVEVRFLNIRELGMVRPIDVLGQVDENTRLVALASAHFISGYKLDIAAIGRSLRDRKILFCLDAIQTVGAFPINVEHVDFLAADAHKWLLGPCGAGIFYVRESLFERLKPPVYGWHNVRCPNYVAQEQIELQPDARRYEVGTHNLVSLAGLKAALELVTAVGPETIARELLRKRKRVLPQLEERGFQVLQKQAAEVNCSGLISFFRPGANMGEIHRRLLEKKVITSLRVDRAGQQFLRISPHFYNTDAELDFFLDQL